MEQAVKEHDGPTIDAETGNEIATREPDATAIGHERKVSDLLTIIERVANNPDIEIERMQALLNMRAEEEERQRRIAREDRDDAARRAFLNAFSAVQQEIGPIIRSRKNTHTNSTYADLADIERIVTPILTQHGFSTTAVPVPCEIDGHIRMRLTIGHNGGHERHYEDDFPLDQAGSGGKVNKTGIQAKGSTQTYARRYLKANALDLSFMDDRDGNRPRADVEKITPDQHDALIELCDDVGADKVKLCEFYGIESLADIPAGAFDKVKSTIERKRSQ